MQHYCSCNSTSESSASNDTLLLQNMNFVNEDYLYSRRICGIGHFSTSLATRQLNQHIDGMLPCTHLTNTVLLLSGAILYIIYYIVYLYFYQLKRGYSKGYPL